MIGYPIENNLKILHIGFMKDLFILINKVNEVKSSMLSPSISNFTQQNVD